MKLITEQIDDAQVVITEGKNGKKQTFIEGVFLQGEITNRNGRRYPIQTLAREAATYNEKFIKTGRALGELGHPEGPTINLDRASHIITKLEQSGNNFIGKARLLETPMGKIAKQLLDEGVKLGVSSRGLGSIKEENGIKVVGEETLFLLLLLILSLIRQHLMLLLMASWKVKIGYLLVAQYKSKISMQLRRELTMLRYRRLKKGRFPHSIHS